MRKLVTAMLAAVAAVVALVGVATPAQAASLGYVYVVVNGSCGVPWATVKDIQVSNSTIGWSLAIDRGDNVVYPRVLIGRANNLQIQAWCYVGKKQVGYSTLTPTITPSYYNQTITVSV